MLVDRQVRVVDRIKVSPDPVRLVVSADGLHCTVASRWSRRLTFVGLATTGTERSSSALSIIGTLDLPFCPRELALVAAADGSKLIVADAFGGRLAVIDTKRRVDRFGPVAAGAQHPRPGLRAGRPRRWWSLIRCSTRLAQASFDDVHWGLLIRNICGSCGRRRSCKPGSDAALLDGSRLFDLGDVGYAAGDPADVAYDAHGNLIVALAGVDEVAITASPDQGPRRIVVGRRPTAVLPSPDGLVGLCRRQSGRHDLRRRDRDRASSGDDLAGPPDPNRPRPTAASDCFRVPGCLTTAG